MNNLSLTMNTKDKIWLIYDEFTKYAPDDVTKKDLLKASQDLISLSKNEYIHTNQLDRKNKLTYQNCDLVEAFTKYENKIFTHEYKKMKNDYQEEIENKSEIQFNKLNKLGN